LGKGHDWRHRFSEVKMRKRLKILYKELKQLKKKNRFQQSGKNKT
jgi:hypothetical protein